MHDVLYLGCALAAGGVLLYKLHGLREAPSATLVAVCLCTGFPMLAFIAAAPSLYTRIGRASGVPDLATLLVYGFITCFSGSAQVLASLWSAEVRHPAEAWEAARPRVIRRLAVFATALSLMTALFAYAACTGALTGGPHPLDFDTFYSTVPTVVVFQFVYQAGFAYALLGVSRACRRHAAHLTDREPERTALRTGVLLISRGCRVALGYSTCKLLAISAAATGGGTTWDVLSTVVGPFFASAGAMLIAAGFAYPAVQAWAGRRRDLLALRPLWLVAADADRHLLLDPLPPATRRQVAVRDLRWRISRCITEIRDAQLAMRIWEDPLTADIARHHARRLKYSAERVEAAASAAALLGAIRTRNAALDNLLYTARTRALSPQALAEAVTATLTQGLGTAAPRRPLRLAATPRGGQRAELDQLILIARALESRPVTMALRQSLRERTGHGR
ncbi:DUF6545 domain-containing protein [Streptomyces albireticuli]|uniref:DUF6545 domain-containing protein n=1 Tax=Streptomyces albireticuli TaxID=1940 RepID=UPI00117EEB6B|nr:DUF6545 domain-containing protein [Streptomyces albireticuli]MCD9165752.1 hypothetical protein [Streptomyces albireticuli]MCD9195970.1 hypothetical protein [Streptomyces albireticuli]